MLNQCVREFILETGERFPLESLASIMRRAVDADTSDRMDEGDVDLSDFAAVESFIKKRESRLRSRGGAGAGKGPDAMVYDVSAPEAAQPPCPPGLSAVEAQAPSLGSLGRSGARPLGSSSATSAKPAAAAATARA